MFNYRYLIVMQLFISFTKSVPVKYAMEHTNSGNDQMASNVHSTQILEFMRKYGYLNSSSSSTSETLYHEDAIIAGIKNMQKYGALNETGELDSATFKLLTTPRCGVPDIPKRQYSPINIRAKRFIFGSRGWQKRHITYYISNWSPKVGEVNVAIGMQQAFELWSRYSGLRFERVFQPDADIIVAFGSGYHGDAFPFDGPGRILAHAFFPYEMVSFGGDIHFDNDENWIENATDLSEGVDFRSVAVHELGHSLGLAHSPIFSSIMFPYYKGPHETKDLDYDDIMAMYELYIKNGVGTYETESDVETVSTTSEKASTTMKSTTSYVETSTKTASTISERMESTTVLPISTTLKSDCETLDTNKHRFSFPIKCKSNTQTNNTPPNLCESRRIDAVASLRGEIFMFKGQYVWRFTESNQLVSGYPIHFNEIFQGIPSYVEKIDAAYERKTDSAIVLFYGKMFWVFDGYSFIEDSPRPISEYGFNENVQQVDAVMVWSKNDRTYLFSGIEFVRYNEEQHHIDAGYPKNISEKWRGIPNNIDAAISLPNEKTYFFKGDLYWLYDNQLIYPTGGYPRRTSTYWLGC